MDSPSASCRHACHETFFSFEASHLWLRPLPISPATRCPPLPQIPVGVHLVLPSLRTHPHAQHCILACGLEACDAARRPRSRFRWPSSHITYFESPMHRITLENQKCTPDIMYQKIMKQCINLIILV
jgi:hypothetical protein